MPTATNLILLLSMWLWLIIWIAHREECFDSRIRISSRILQDQLQDRHVDVWEHRLQSRHPRIDVLFRLCYSSRRRAHGRLNWELLGGRRRRLCNMGDLLNAWSCSKRGSRGRI